MKNILLVAFTLLTSTSALAAIGLNPGLWEVKSVMKVDGKVMDHQADMKKSMAHMTPEKRKQMEAIMAKMGGHMPSADGAMKICLNKEMLNRDDALSAHQSKECETKILEHSSSKVKMKYDCKNGSSGEGEWNLHGGTSYEGKMITNLKNGKKSEMTQQGKFVSADCGTVKPLLSPEMIEKLKGKKQ